jgi:hypothetical protein
MSAWVVDTCVILDIATKNSQFGTASARILKEKLQDGGLVIAPVTFAELAPVFNTQLDDLKQFLNRAGLNWQEPWTLADTETAFAAWGRYVQIRRQRFPGRRPMADLLIGAFASRFQGLITRNPRDFAAFFPGMQILVPK